jgi:hypothetical protein
VLEAALGSRPAGRCSSTLLAAALPAALHPGAGARLGEAAEAQVVGQQAGLLRLRGRRDLRETVDHKSDQEAG